MITLENIEAIFNILHDGIISAWGGGKEALMLTVECQYLAERISPSFNMFYIVLYSPYRVELEVWENSRSSIPKTNLADIFKTELEIISAKIEGDFVKVSCYLDDESYSHSGGNLRVSCEAIKVLDQNREELSLEQFQELSESYWENF